MPDIKIKGWSGTDFQYQDVPKLWLNAPESTEEAPVLVPYTYGEAVSKTVDPDFSGGDMAVEIPDGELVKELTITKPETLTPENIAEGVSIAGILGTFAGGGKIKYACGFAGSGGPITIEHGLGEIPDIVLVYGGTYGNSLQYATGISTKFQQAVQGDAGFDPKSMFNFCLYHNGNSNVRTFGVGGNMDVNTSGPGIHNATSNSFSVASSTYPIFAYVRCYWVALVLGL